MENYFDELLKQGQLNICPTCFKNGEREPMCTNAVLLMPEEVLVLCCLGIKHEVSTEAFEKLVQEVKNKKG